MKSDQTKKKKGTPPLIPPQWGNGFNNSPLWSGAAFAAGRKFSVFPDSPKKRIKNTNKK
jgi:hypothetical protein